MLAGGNHTLSPSTHWGVILLQSTDFVVQVLQHPTDSYLYKIPVRIR